MMKIDVLTTILLVVIVIYCLFFVLKNRRISNMKKLYYIMAFSGLLVYSGISTIYEGLCEEFFPFFLIYAIVFSLSFVGACYVRIGKYGKNYTDSELASISSKKTSILDSSILSDKFLLVMTILNFTYLIIQFVYPVNRLSNLFTFSFGMEKVDFFLQRDTGRSLPLYQLFYYIDLSTTVFKYIYVDRLIKRKKLGMAIFIIALKMYLSIALEQYIGRSGIVSNVLFLLLIVVYERKGRNLLKESTKLFFVLGVIFFLSIPAMYAYEFLRLGLSARSINASDAIRILIWQETHYGEYYHTLVELHSGNAFLNWLIWLVTLPIPSFLIGFKSNLLLVNQALSEYITGVPYGHMYYSVKLPSLFGESLYTFGPLFFWMHALVIAVFLNKLSGMLEKQSELGVLNIYFATSCLLIGRGGSSSLFPQAVNYIAFFGIIMIVLRSFAKRSEKHIREGIINV